MSDVRTHAVFWFMLWQLLRLANQPLPIFNPYPPQEASMRLQTYLPLLILLMTVSAHAQGGCVDSPECPIAVLAVVGSAGVAAVRAYYRFRVSK